MNHYNEESEYIPGQVVPFPSRPWPSFQHASFGLPQPADTKMIEESSRRIVPLINKYSISKYSPQEWQQHNANVIEGGPIRNANNFEVASKTCLKNVYGLADQKFNHCTDLLKNRAHDIYHWKCETEHSIKAMTIEIMEFEELLKRLKAALAILEQPELIAKQCFELRSNRLNMDLVNDTPEAELNNELSLIVDIRNLYTNTLADMEIQQKKNKAIKARVELDWSDKVNSYDTESLNVSLHKESNTILMKPGAVRISEDQSTCESWEQFTKYTLQEAEETRQQSMNFRKHVETMILNASRDLRTQAGRVDQALAEKVASTDDIRIRLEDELKETLQKLSMTEIQTENLKEALNRMNVCMKLNHTRLDNRTIMGRPNVENCRDPSQSGLLNEAQSLSEAMHALSDKLYSANQARVKLLKSRSELEKEIAVKKKSLSIDRDRCKTVRSLYPSASKLSGLE